MGTTFEGIYPLLITTLRSIRFEGLREVLRSIRFKGLRDVLRRCHAVASHLATLNFIFHF